MTSKFKTIVRTYLLDKHRTDQVEQQLVLLGWKLQVWRGYARATRKLGETYVTTQFTKNVLSVFNDVQRLRDLNRFPSRICKTVHHCCLCHRDITNGQDYLDGGYNYRAHVQCWQAIRA